MDRKKAKAILEAGDCLQYHAWTWCGLSMSCYEGCCDDYYENIQKALDAIEDYTGNNWSRVEEV